MLAQMYNYLFITGYTLGKSENSKWDHICVDVFIKVLLILVQISATPNKPNLFSLSCYQLL